MTLRLPKISDAEARDRLTQLEDALRDDRWIPFDWRLTPKETATMNALAMRKLATKEAIHTLMYGNDPSGGAEIKIIDVFICKLRRKLQPFDIKIETVWGQGYTLPAETRAKIDALKRGEKITPPEAGDEIELGSALAKSTGRLVKAIALPANMQANRVTADRPRVRMVRPTELRIEASYQRDLSPKSLALIRKIVCNWDWRRFKPPVCAETDGDLVVIDGQHTATAAASHPDIELIPVLVVPAEDVEDRADSFVAHNRDRIPMSPIQIFHAEVTSGAGDAAAIDYCVREAGGYIPRNPENRTAAKVGSVMCTGELQRTITVGGPPLLERVIRIGVAAGLAPIHRNVIRGLRHILTEEEYADVALASDAAIASAVASTPALDVEAKIASVRERKSVGLACAGIIANSFRGAAT